MRHEAVVLAVFFLASPLAAEGPWLSSLEDAKAAAANGGRPILADFSAVWCYSCYYMERRVLNGEGFKKAAGSLVLLKLDVDKDEGSALKKKYGVSFLPSFLVLDASGAELGRIIGEQTEGDFLGQLAALSGKSRDAQWERLRTLMDSGDLAGADRLRRGLARPESPQGKLLSARLDLRLARKRADAEAAASALEKISGLEQDCALAYDVFQMEDLLSFLSPARARASLRSQRDGLEAVVEKKVFGPEGERCADLRSAVEALGDVYARLELTREREALLGRTIGLLQGLSKRIGVGDDRNLDDNLRQFLETASRERELEEYYPRLIAAYPADHVYAYRFAKYLAGRGKYAQALPMADKAYALSYGANRPQVGGLKADILERLGRKDEAAALRRLLKGRGK